MSTESSVEIRLPSALSPSSLDTYRTCPRKFYYEKVERRPTTSNVKAELGTFGHLLLEHLLNLEPQQRTLDATKELAKDLWEQMKAGDIQPTLAEMIDVEMSEKQMKDHVWKSAVGFFSMARPKSITVYSTEQYLTGFVGTVPMRGYVDYTTLVGDKLHIVDNKTGKAPWGEDVAKKLSQVGVYCALIEDEVDREVAKGVLLYLHPRKRFELDWSPEAKAAIVAEAEEVWYSILGDFERGWFDPNPNFLCWNDDPEKVWCDFKAICPHWT